MVAYFFTQNRHQALITLTQKVIHNIYQLINTRAVAYFSVAHYEQKWYPKDWIGKHLREIAVRNNLTDV